MKQFPLQIVTPDGVKYDAPATGLIVRTGSGDVEILAGHTDLIASVVPGRVKVRFDGGERIGAASGGFLSVKGGEVRLVATTFEYSDEIDLVRAERAKAAAEEAIKNKRSDVELDVLKAKLARALCRIRVGSGK